MSSDSGTLHVFDLHEGATDSESNSPEQPLGSDSDDETENKEIYINQVKDDSKPGFFGSLMTSIKNSIPGKELISYQKSSMSHFDEDLKTRNVACMDSTERKALVFTDKGEFRYFDIDFRTNELKQSYKADYI